MVKIINSIHEPIEVFIDSKGYVVESGDFIELGNYNLPKTVKIMSFKYSRNKINPLQCILCILKGILKSLFCILFQDFFNKQFYSICPYKFVSSFDLPNSCDRCEVIIKDNDFCGERCRVPDISSNCDIVFNNNCNVNINGIKCKWIEILSSFFFAMLILFVIFGCVLVSSLHNSNLWGSIIAIALILVQVLCCVYFVVKENRHRIKIMANASKNNTMRATTDCIK